MQWIVHQVPLPLRGTQILEDSTWPIYFLFWKYGGPTTRRLTRSRVTCVFGFVLLGIPCSSIRPICLAKRTTRRAKPSERPGFQYSRIGDSTGQYSGRQPRTPCLASFWFWWTLPPRLMRTLCTLLLTWRPRSILFWETNSSPHHSLLIRRLFDTLLTSCSSLVNPTSTC